MVTESGKLDTVRDWIPFEVKHGVNRLYLNPPASLLQGISNQVRIVSIADDKFVAVFNIGIFKRNLAHGPFEHIVCFSTLCQSLMLLNCLLLGLELHSVQLL